MKDTMTTPRIVWVDWMRVAACFMVILYLSYIPIMYLS